MLYQELLESCKERFDSFFKNASIFENQFTWNEYNAKCYELMYTKNSSKSICPVKSLKEEIPELSDLCKKCGKFFIPARNDSIPQYDVIMGQQHEEALMEFISKKINADVTRADLEERKLPDCKVLRADGTIAAYFEVKFHGAPFVTAWRQIDRYCYEGSATLDYKKIKNQLDLIESSLDAPVFYVHWIEYPCIKGVFYETSEQLSKYISVQHEVFERKKRLGDDQKSKEAVYLKKVYSPLLDMQDFDSFIDVLSKLVNG